VVDLVLQGTASVLIQFSVPIILGLIRLRGRAKALGRRRACLAWIWDADGIKRGLVVIVAILFALFNLSIVVIYPIPPYSGTIPGWVIPTIVVVLLIAAVLYYILFFRAAVLASEPDLQGYSTNRHGLSFSLLRLAGINCVVSKKECFDIERDKRARRFGTRRSISFEVSGFRSELQRL